MSMPSISRRPFYKSSTKSKKQYPCIVQSIINLCSKGQIKQAVDSLHFLSRKGIRLDSDTLSLLLHHCANLKLLREGKWAHLHLKLTGLKHPGVLVSSHLINMYAKCGDHVEARNVFDKMPVRNLFSWNNMLSGYAGLKMVKPARRVFDEMPERDVVSWNTMVIAYANNGYSDQALRFYKELRRLAIGVNEFSFAGVVTVCVKNGDLELTRQVHCQVLVVGFLSNVVLSSSIIDSYSKSGAMVDARRLFDEMTWRDVRAWTTLVSGYAKWGDMRSANELFQLMPEKNPVSWTAMIAGFARNGMGSNALELFRKMMFFRIRPDQFTFSSSLCACASLASLKHGKQIHAYLIRIGFKPNTIVVSSLIDMYSKCGNLIKGRWVFDIMGYKRDCVLWNTMMSAVAHHSYSDEAIRMFYDMVKSGVKPDRITFFIMIKACSQSRKVDEGIACFNSMTCDYCIVPDQEHYACLIDLLGRAGRFEELISQLEKIPCKSENLNLAIQAAENGIQMEPESSTAYVVLSSIYASIGRWEAVEKVRQLMNERHVKKERGIS